MKAVLAVLLCYLLFDAECCFAHQGGPFEGGRGFVVTTGNYAGVLVPAGLTDNSLGIFTVNVPTIGLAGGTIAFFRNGYYYPGTIQGIADPDSAILTAVANATFNITFTSITTSGGTTTTTDFVVTFNANGGIAAKIKPNKHQLSTATARLTGSADITFATVGDAPGFDQSLGNSFGPVPYVVDGFKQSGV